MLLSLLVALSAALALYSGYSVSARSHPTDDDLIVKFLSNESDFQSLVHILEADRGSLLSLGGESYEFTDHLPTGAAAVHWADYKALLARIGLTNFRYFPRSGNLILPASMSPDNSAEIRRSYLYLVNNDPEPLLRYASDSWRGPGIHFTTGDRRIKGNWFIHHEGTLVVAFSPF